MLFELVLLVWAIGATYLMLRYKRIAEQAVEIGNKLVATLLDVSGKVAVAQEHLDNAIAIDEELKRQQAWDPDLTQDRMN